jgi:hypothetical protein
MQKTIIEQNKEEKESVTQEIIPEGGEQANTQGNAALPGVVQEESITQTQEKIPPTPPEEAAAVSAPEQQENVQAEAQNVQEESIPESQSQDAPVPEESTGLKRISELAKQSLGDALGKKANTTVSLTREGEHWRASVEVVEEEYLPGMNLRSMNDIIALYEVTLDGAGELLEWTKKSSYKRGK